MALFGDIFGMTRPRSYWRDRFDAWKRPPSDTEENKISRTADAIKSALKKNAFLSSLDLSVFGQGSYRNNTNVRLNSDMDICVLWRGKVQFASAVGEVISLAELGLTPLHEPLERSYARFKEAVYSALVDEFGWFDVHSGNKAIGIHSEGNTIVQADIVPAVCYWRLHESRSWYGNTPIRDDGILIIADDGSRICNYPEQHYANGVTKNKTTSMRYKQVVRILKRLQMNIGEANLFYESIPSFLIECLAFNCSDAAFQNDDIFENVLNVLREIEWMTSATALAAQLYEVNLIKPLFVDHQPWHYAQANQFAKSAIDAIGV